jgi:glycosyltransferase involved in cell wall biosynthesis
MENKSSAGVRFDMSSREMISERPVSAAKLPPSLGPASVTVVICCHNSAARLPETLRHLAEQKVPLGIEWEIVVVDNASTDDTVAVARRFAAEHEALSVRVVPELQLGQTYARLRGLREGRGEFILFVDDDNWLDPEYVALVSRTMGDGPEIAALGGMSTAVHEQEPPPWMSRHQRWYAVSGPPKESDELTEVEFLWGAGTAFRRSVLEQIVSAAFRLPGRQGTELPAGDDDELCCRLRLLGKKLFCSPRLRFQHYLPAPRMQWSYLRRLHYAAGEASVPLDAYRFRLARAKVGWPGWLLRSWIAQMCNVCWQIWRRPILLRRAQRESMEGDQRVLRIEMYSGRLKALKRHRRTYRRMLTDSQST